jgi:hypothetical protein
MTEGYIYVISNPSFGADIFKVGYTDKTPTERLKEANSTTWAFPTFKLEFAKKVIDARDKEQKLHRTLGAFARRIHPKREFFNVQLKSIMLLFDMIDGEMWVQTPEVPEIISDATETIVRDRLAPFVYKK